MTMIPKDIVESTWREVSSFERRDVGRLMNKITKRQPVLLAYVLGETQECRSDAHELAVYLFTVVFRMFERLPGQRLKRVSIKQVERRAAQNETLLEQLLGAHDRFVERTAQIQAEGQPHVFDYLSEAILAVDDPDLELTEYDSGLVFLVLKTVVDLLDSACRKRRS